MDYELGIQENALDSFHEALSKFREGEAGENRAFKFAILHMAHFVELVLKLYVMSVDENLVYSKCFRVVAKRGKDDGINRLQAFKALENEGFDFEALISGHPSPHTITVDDALSLAKNEICQVTGVDLVDQEFIDDIQWMKGLRDNITHFQFSLPPKDVRLCIGRLVRGIEEFIDLFSLFNLRDEIDEAEAETFDMLADEYTQMVAEAKREVQDARDRTYRGTRKKHWVFIDWNVYECPECHNDTMIPDDDSSTGYKCTLCENEESDDIEIPCDCCGTRYHQDDLSTWDMDDGTFENRCYYCTGQYYADKDD